MPRKITVSLPDATLREYLTPDPDVTVLEWDLSGEPPRQRLDIVVPRYMGGPAVLRGLEGVETGLVQSQSIGYDGVADFLPGGRVFANAASVHETSTAELTLALILASQRELPRILQNQRERRWEGRATASLADQRVLIVGYGGVGKAIEDRILPFETTVTRVASRARTDDRGPVHGVDELPVLLPEHDVVVVVVPLTEQPGDDGRRVPGPDGRRGAVRQRRPRAGRRHRRAAGRAALGPAARGHRRHRPGAAAGRPPALGGARTCCSPRTSAAPARRCAPRMGKLLQRQIDLMLAGEPPVNVVLNG